MYLQKIIIENFRCFGEGEKRFTMPLRPGLTALVGENDAGKTAVIDALRFVFGTTDQEWQRLDDDDFHAGATPREIRITCTFAGLSDDDQRDFLEYLTYSREKDGEPLFHIRWTAVDTGETLRGRPYRRVAIHSGETGNGPPLAQDVRDLLRVTYLRPLRDAAEALSSGRGSRLARVLRNTDQILKEGTEFIPEHQGPLDVNALNLRGIGDLANHLLVKQAGVADAGHRIDENLAKLALDGDNLRSSIKVGGADSSADARLRQLLEKLELRLTGEGRLGLGSDNLLFMACEFLLLTQEKEGNRMLLIEEPEAHLHAQRQLRVMKFLQDQAEEKKIQVIVTTHSPILASVLKLDSLVMIQRGCAFAMAEGETELERSDYRFLERFLDVTKANLFFARGVLIVEGDAENILLPTLAALLGRDFTKHGVSVVNVGGTGLRRYARIFLRKYAAKDGQLDIPVACLADLDVMPDCAPYILEKIKNPDDVWPERAKRRWLGRSDFETENRLIEHRDQIAAKASGQTVRTFVSDYWTLEYDLALGPLDAGGRFTGGLAEEVYVAACLARDDEKIQSLKKEKETVVREAGEHFNTLREKAGAESGCAKEEMLASEIYAQFARDDVSKAIAAQHLAECLTKQNAEGRLNKDELRAKLPRYIVEVIDYVTRAELPGQGEEKTTDA